MSPSTPVIASEQLESEAHILLAGPDRSAFVPGTRRNGCRPIEAVDSNIS
jgi:hypothetical protein